MRKLIHIVIIILMLICMLSSKVYAYENEIFKIDIPSDYEEIMSFSNAYLFTKGEEYGLVINSAESFGLKKNLFTMSRTEIKELVDKIFEDDVNVLEHKKEKLGKAKAIKARAMLDNSYLDMYITVSDKHILLVTFVAPSEEELDSEEYKDIKDSFKMKERTTNSTLIKVGIGAIAVAGAFFKYRKRFM